MDPPLGVAAGLDETGLAQHPQVLGHRRLADARADDLAEGRSPSASRSRIRRRLGSASTSKVAAVALIFPISYIAVKAYLWGRSAAGHDGRGPPGGV